jgi:hypothetical protein
MFDTSVFSVKFCPLDPVLTLLNLNWSVRWVFERCTKFSAVADGQASGSLPFLQAL